VILHYLRLSVWPHPLCFDYYGWPSPTTWKSIVPPAVVLAVFLGATLWRLKARTAWGFFAAWFFLTVAPSSSVIPLDSPAYEHRMYLPLAGLVVLGVLGIHGLVGRRCMVVVAALAVGFGFLTWRRNLDYRSELFIWQDTVLKRPNNPRAHTNLGLALVHAGRVQEAIAHYELALRIKPDSSEARYNLEMALGRTGTAQDAIEHYQRALQVRPDSAEAYENLGLALAQAGRPREAIEYFEHAARLKPDDAEAHNNLAVALIQLGRTPEAIGHWTEALRIRPDDAEMHYNLGNALLVSGQVRAAEEHWLQALTLNPELVAAQNSLARLLATLAPAEGGDPARAVALAERACDLSNNQVAPYVDTLAIAYAAAGRFNDAIRTALKAIELARSAGQAQWAGEIEHRLELYRSGRAYRPPRDPAAKAQ
jgi:tetratricopeptide (TPR) repeat protein